MTFAPERSVRIAASEVSAGASLPSQAPLALVTNLGPAVVFLKFGTGEIRADAQHDVPVLAGHQLLLTKGVGADAVAAVCETGETASVYITVGTGS